ncbi:SCF E3 ubiquitin ligase complex F-box protein grrA-like [Haliotis rubra]|uniref:SCF E3 ubiquitin ligase complex F-box protein grrA-like n=1 Tax=Haliotis rubra TaxID=36100 RepID=UPI001EE57700|nr:SCF E3 ubiquitin ligase complex F-box protein grrA-like [Haliotis rubra]
MASKLPTEVISHLMSFLSVSDRKEAALVNTAWYEASMDPALQRDMVVNFSDSNVTNCHTRRKLTHLLLNHIDNSTSSVNEMVKFFEYMSESLINLSLKGSNITEGTFVKLLSLCKNLTVLDLTSCNSLFMSGNLLDRKSDVQSLKESLQHVKKLNLASVRFLSDVSFNRILSVCPNVEELSLAHAQITFNSSTYYPQGSKVGTNSAVLTFHNVLDFVDRQGPKLKSLNLSRTTIANCHLSELARCQNIALEELILVGCREITDSGLGQFCRQQKSLQRLDISSCTDITDSGIAAVATNLTQLRSFKANKCRQMTDNSVKLFKYMSLLESLDLSECYELFSQGMIQGLCSGIQSKLTHLNLSCCTALTDYFVVELTKTVPSLVHLDLGSLFNITDISVHAVSKRLKHLRYLRLAWCKELSDKGLLGLEELDDSKYETHVLDGHNGQCRCTRRHSEQGSNIFKKPSGSGGKDKKMSIGDLEAMVKNGGELYSLSNLSGLRTLDLTSCSKFTDLGLKEAIKFKELKSLSLGMVHGMTNESLVAIARNNPSLEEVHLNQCINITDAAVEALTSKCPRLAHLDVSSCDRLTNHTLYYVETNCHRLRHLDVSYCSGLTPEAVDKLEGSMKGLHTVHKRLVGSTGTR